MAQSSLVLYGQDSNGLYCQLDTYTDSELKCELLFDQVTTRTRKTDRYSYRLDLLSSKDALVSRRVFTDEYQCSKVLMMM